MISSGRFSAVDDSQQGRAWGKRRIEPPLSECWGVGSVTFAARTEAAASSAGNSTCHRSLTCAVSLQCVGYPHNTASHSKCCCTFVPELMALCFGACRCSAPSFVACLTLSAVPFQSRILWFCSSSTKCASVQPQPCAHDCVCTIALLCSRDCACIIAVQLRTSCVNKPSLESVLVAIAR
jgi:hypothetical protein